MFPSRPLRTAPLTTAVQAYSGCITSTDVGAASEAACRSEEHTSELQSQSNLVCRLLLEKKKNNSYEPLRPTICTTGATIASLSTYDVAAAPDTGVSSAAGARTPACRASPRHRTR